MSGPILWGRGSSTNVQKVIWTCVELGLTPERRIVGGPYGGTDSDAFGALNPNRTIPVWQEDGSSLWESHAIMRHLARRHRGLYGATEEEHAAVDCQLDWFASVFFPPIRLLFLDVHVKGSLTIDAGPAQAALADLHRALALAEDRTSRTGHFAGSTFSLADIAMAVGLNRASGLPFEIIIPPALRTWFDVQANRPGFALAVADEPALPGNPVPASGVGR